MKRTNKCPKCESGDVIANAHPVGPRMPDSEGKPTWKLTVMTFRKPEAMLFKGLLTTTISAWVCADCGYVELYADSPRSIKVDGS
jgi:hypothetical protein